MPRFDGIPVASAAAPLSSGGAGPRFAGTPTTGDVDSGLSLSDLITGKPSAQSTYDAALEQLRQKQYPDIAPDDFKRMAANPMSGMNPANLGDLAKQGILFGSGDEIASTVGAIGSQIQNWMGNKGAPNFGDAFGNYEALQNARMKLGEEQQGLPGTVAETASGLVSMGPEKAALDAIVNGTRTAATTVPTLLKTALASSGTGAGIGGIAGFTNTDGDVGQRLVGAAKGTLGGAAVGAAVPVVARGVSSVVDALLSTQSANQAAKALNISPDAAKFLQTQMGVDDSLSPAGLSRIAAAGPEGMLADAGPAAKNVLDYAVQSSGKAGQMAREEIGGRVSRDAGAINDALDTYLGKPAGVDTARADIRTTTAPARGNAYDTAYAQPIDYASEDGRQIESLLQRVPQQAIDRANNLMRIKGEKSPQIMAQIGDDGTTTFKTMPDVRQLDYITRGLNEEAKHGIGAGAMGGQTTIGSALGDLSGEIRDTLRLHVPEYGDALATGQDAIQRSQAVQNGYDLLKPSTTREDVSGWAKGMTPTQRTDAAQGIRSHISDAVSNVTRTLSDGDVPAREALKVLRDLSTTASRDKVASVIGQQNADGLFGELDRATKSFELRAAVADNSKTFQRQSMNRQVDSFVDSNGIINTLKKGEPVNAGKRAIQIVTGATPERALAGKDAMMQDVVKALLARGNGAVSHAQAIQRLGVQRAGAGNVRDAILSLGHLAGPGANLTGQQVGGSP